MIKCFFLQTLFIKQPSIKNEPKIRIHQFYTINRSKISKLVIIINSESMEYQTLDLQETKMLTEELSGQNENPKNLIGENNCRICLQGEQDEKLQMCPCKCIGSLGLVHTSCLEKWLTIQRKRGNNIECDICKSPLYYEIKLTFLSPEEAYTNILLNKLKFRFCFTIVNLLFSLYSLVFLSYFKQSFLVPWSFWLHSISGLKWIYNLVTEFFLQRTVKLKNYHPEKQIDKKLEER